MKPFMDESFLLHTETARTLYNTYAAPCPIYDYHNHLDPHAILTRQRYRNLTELWLKGDHYKWRCMRACGVEERLITGDADDYEKFFAFASVLPRLIGNPVYHWAHLELQRYFHIDTPLTEQTAPEIWEKTCALLASDGYDCVSLLERTHVKVLCTTDDPADTLENHRLIREAASLPFDVLPSFRPDRFLHVSDAGFLPAIAALGERYGAITDWESLKKALLSSLDFFVAHGCRVTDHGFLRFRYAVGEPAPLVKKALSGESLTEKETAIVEGALLRFLAAAYQERGLIMQLHLGPIRNNSPKLLACFGADAGGDSIGVATDPFLLGQFLGDLEAENALPRTILYNLNPADSAMLATMAVNFCSHGSKVQYGAAWWLLDNIRGINEQLDLLMETGLLSESVGMLTDSRSFSSFVRHEYFRRILCDKLGTLVENGEYPLDIERLGGLVKRICSENARTFFDF